MDFALPGAEKMMKHGGIPEFGGISLILCGLIVTIGAVFISEVKALFFDA
jgi:hypothetical protein